MRRGGLILLAVVAAAMAALLIFEARRSPVGSGAPSAALPARVLPPFDRKTVRTITIHRFAAGQAYSMRHVPSPNVPAPAPAWQIALPNAPAADDAAVQDLLAAADLAESDRGADLSPEQAGLKPPGAELAIETPLGAIALQFGRVDATGQRVYARQAPDGPIRVIGRRMLDLVDRPPDAFRDRRLFPVEAATVTAIDWHGDDGAGALRAVGRRWQNGRGEAVDAARVADSLRRLRALHIDKFETAPPANRDSPRTLTLTAGPARVAVEIGSGGAVTRDGEGLRVPPDELESAWRSLGAAAARDDRLVTQAPDAVTAVELSDDRARLRLARVKGEWTFASPKVAYAADTRAVDAWLARLGAVRTATKSGGPHARRLAIEGRYQEQVEVSAPREVYALLAPDPLRFRERALLSFARFDVRRLKRVAGKSAEEVTSDDGGTWRTPSDGQPDAANVARVVGALGDLRAGEFVAAPPSGAAAARLAVDVQPPGERQPARHTLDLWPLKEGACVARLDGDSTFTLDAPTCEALRLDLLRG